MAKPERNYKHYRDYLDSRGVPDVAVCHERDSVPAPPPPSRKLSKTAKTNIN